LEALKFEVGGLKFQPEPPPQLQTREPLTTALSHLLLGAAHHPNCCICPQWWHHHRLWQRQHSCKRHHRISYRKPSPNWERRYHVLL